MNNEEKILSILEQMNTHIGSIDTRLGGVETRLSGVEIRLDSLENRMGSMESRMDSMENRMGGLESRMDSMENRMGGLESRMDSMENRVDTMQSQMNTMQNQMGVMQETLTRVSLTQENVVLPRIQLLLEGHAGLAETRATNERVAALEKNANPQASHGKAILRSGQAEIRTIKKSAPGACKTPGAGFCTALH